MTRMTVANDKPSYYSPLKKYLTVVDTLVDGKFRVIPGSNRSHCLTILHGSTMFTATNTLSISVLGVHNYVSCKRRICAAFLCNHQHHK